MNGNYVPVQVLRYNNVHASLINQDLNFKVRGMKGMTEETWTGRTTELQAFASLSNWMDMVVTQHTCISISCYQVTAGMEQLSVQILLT